MDGNQSSNRAMRFVAILRRAGWFFSGMAVLGACLLFRAYAPAGSASAKPPASKVQKASATEKVAAPTAAPPAAAAPKKNPMAALVNNEPITREDLASECLLHYGGEVLESMVNRELISSSCRQRNITITDKQVDEEIDRMAKRFSMTKDQWFKILEKERSIKPARYAQDIVWPMLALRQLAKERLTVSRKELDEAYESEFGPAVKVRLIAIDSAEQARTVHAEAKAKPEEFAALAKKHSKDVNSASAYGLIQPIRRHAGDPNLEKAAFALKKGEVSPIVKVGEMYVFVKCEEQLPPPKGVDRTKVEPMLIDGLKDRKLRAAANDVFKQLQQTASIDVVYGDPARTKQRPGVAATINERTITVRELAEECIDRHGTDVLEGCINRKLLDQSLRKNNLKVADGDVSAEIARAALTMGKVGRNGEADVDAWIKHVTEAENISRDVYVRDEVWPSTALKKLVGNSVEVTQEDLHRGYDANYWPKVLCRAICLNNQRRAQEVWAKARENPTSKHFGDLAEQYSVETTSRTLRGEVPPVQKNGGQPVLEQEAFSLTKENPLSGIIQSGTMYVILFFEGRTKPIDTNFAEVKDLLYQDILEKKMRLSMAKTFDELKDSAQIDNFLTGTIKTPKKVEQAAALDPAVKLPQVIKR
jgi:parvulin-like peptidyl-prolyl isomerase